MSETEKMLNIIHENCKTIRENKKILTNENQKKEKRKKRIEILCLILTMFIILALFGVYENEKQIKKCMEDGYSENFCRYAGE